MITAYNREGNKRCLDMYDYSACSIYRFSIENVSNVSQLLVMSLYPTANSYTNLKFKLYEITTEGNNLIQDTTNFSNTWNEGTTMLIELPVPEE